MQVKLLIPVLILLLLMMGSVKPQDSGVREEYWPEVNVFINIKPKVRVFLLGTVSKSVEDGEIRNAQSYEAQIGAHVDYIPNKHVILRTGYRYGTAVGDNDDGFRKHRLLTEQTLRKLFPGDLLVSDRNRQDFRFINGDYSFRYRNRVTLEREFQIPKLAPEILTGRSITPYGSVEVFYDTRYNVWNRNRWAIGVQQSLRRRALLKMVMPKRQIILDVYVMRQNDSRSSSPHVNAVGAVLIFHF